jgi:hypothetical protein
VRRGRILSIIGGAAAGWTAVLLLFAASVHFSSRVFEERQLSARKAAKGSAAGIDLLAEIGRRPSFAFGFRNFLSDVVWLKAVQVSGARHMAPEDYDRLFLLLDTVIDFDPRFKVPYLLGGVILGDSPDHSREALLTLSRGRKNHPLEWRFPFYIGYIRYFSLGDPIRGGEALGEASRLPESPRYLPLLAARMLSEGRKPETALAFLEEMVRQETNAGRREALMKRIREVIVERDIQMLERAVAEYRARTGRLPERFDDLAGAGLIRTVPMEPNGGRYFMAPGGEIRSDRIGDRMKVFRNK